MRLGIAVYMEVVQCAGLVVPARIGNSPVGLGCK